MFTCSALWFARLLGHKEIRETADLADEGLNSQEANRIPARWLDESAASRVLAASERPPVEYVRDKASASDWASGIRPFMLVFKMSNWPKCCDTHMEYRQKQPRRSQQATLGITRYKSMLYEAARVSAHNVLCNPIRKRPLWYVQSPGVRQVRFLGIPRDRGKQTPKRRVSQAALPLCMVEYNSSEGLASVVRPVRAKAFGVLGVVEGDPGIRRKENQGEKSMLDNMSRSDQSQWKQFFWASCEPMPFMPT